MTAARTRIGRVTLKDGGASVRVLYGPERQSERGKIERAVRQALDSIDEHTSGPVGFAFVVWSAERQTMTDCWTSLESAVPYTLIPAFAAASLEREIIADRAVQLVHLGNVPDNISG